MSESAASLAALKQRIAMLEHRKDAHDHALFTLGSDNVDCHLGGGLAIGRLHEIFAAEPGDSASAGGFALMLAHRAAGGGAILWLRQEQAERQGGKLHAPGLAELGIDPARLILAIAGDTKALLRAAADGLRCAGLGAVVIEPWQSPHAIDLTVSRRLTLAAEQSGVTAFLVRAGVDPMPSAAQTRWEVRAALSEALAADTPGHAAFDIKLLRQRAGRDGLAWHLEWNRDRHIFHEPASSRLVLPVSSGGSLAADTFA